ncbi:hypothetical protein GCM10028798_04620 [Humibacter antri]
MVAERGVVIERGVVAERGAVAECGAATECGAVRACGGASVIMVLVVLGGRMSQKYKMPPTPAP